MRLLFDQNLSYKLCSRLTDLFPNSTQARLIGMDASEDAELWRYARTNDLVIVTQDEDFFDRSALHGFPPKVIWLRCGNQRTTYIEALFRQNIQAIQDFEGDTNAGVLELG